MADRCTIMGLCIDSVNSLAPLIHGQISEAISLPAQPSNETGRDAKRLGRICERLTWPTSISRSVSGIGDRLAVDSWPTVLCTLEDLSPRPALDARTLRDSQLLPLFLGSSSAHRHKEALPGHDAPHRSLDQESPSNRIGGDTSGRSSTAA